MADGAVAVIVGRARKRQGGSSKVELGVVGGEGIAEKVELGRGEVGSGLVGDIEAKVEGDVDVDVEEVEVESTMPMLGKEIACVDDGEGGGGCGVEEIKEEVGVEVAGVESCLEAGVDVAGVGSGLGAGLLSALGAAGVRSCGLGAGSRSLAIGAEKAEEEDGGRLQLQELMLLLFPSEHERPQGGTRRRRKRGISWTSSGKWAWKW